MRNNWNDQLEISYNHSKFQFQEDTWKILLMESRLWCCFTSFLCGHSNWEKKQVNFYIPTCLIELIYCPPSQLEFFFFCLLCIMVQGGQIFPHIFFSLANIGLAKKFVWLGNMLFNTVLGENEKCVSYFYLKWNELFGQPNIWWKI